MQVEVTKKLFTVDEYYQMAAAGILGPQDRVELIDGEIIQMSPIGDRHATSVLRKTNLLVLAFGGRALINVQNPIRLDNYTEPEPDITVLKPRLDYYKSKKIRAEDALLIIEVAETSFQYDRYVKLSHYAAARVPEVWIENVATDELLVFREPVDKSYSVCLTLHRTDTVSPIAFPDIIFKLDDLLG